MAEKEIIISRKTKYKGPIFDVEVATVKTADQQLATRDIVRRMPAIGVLAFKDENTIYLEKQWRTTAEKFFYEIPAGKIDERDVNNEDIYMHAVNRELNEELRMQAHYVEPLANFYETIGMSDVEMYFFIAKDLTPISESDYLPRDVGENFDILEVTFEEMEKMFLNGQLDDGKTLMAFLYWNYLKNKS